MSISRYLSVYLCINLYLLQREKTSSTQTRPVWRGSGGVEPFSLRRFAPKYSVSPIYLSISRYASVYLCISLYLLQRKKTSSTQTRPVWRGSGGVELFSLRRFATTSSVSPIYLSIFRYVSVYLCINLYLLQRIPRRQHKHALP